MKFRTLNLQLFGEGGDGAEGTAASDSAKANIGAIEDAGKPARKGKGNPLQDVVYGKQEEKEMIAVSEKDEDSKPSKIPFDELIRGEYKNEFEKKTQSIINKRFRETKTMEEALKSHNTILNMLADKYGVDANDIDSLTRALEGDNGFYEQEALEKGLTVEQLKEIKNLERENREFRLQHEQQRMREESERIYADWTRQAEELKATYGLENFSLEEEVNNNPDFVKLLQMGISVDSAYKAIHMDEMIGGAMAKTASTVREKMSNAIQSRQARPAENGINQTTSKVFKTDVTKLTRQDREEIERRVMRGEHISF